MKIVLKYLVLSLVLSASVGAGAQPNQHPSLVGGSASPSAAPSLYASHSLYTASTYSAPSYTSPLMPTASPRLATEPSFEYHNSLLERRIAVPVASRVNNEKGRANTSYAPAGGQRIHVASPLRKATPLTTSSGLFAGPLKGGSLKGGSASFPMPGPIIKGPDGGGDNVGGLPGGGIGGGPGDRRPGELAPIGDALLPMLIAALLYALFLLMRGDAREDSQHVHG